MFQVNSLSVKCCEPPAFPVCTNPSFSSGRNIFPLSQKPARSLAWLLVVFEPKKPALKDLLEFWSNVFATPAQSGYFCYIRCQKT